MFTQHKNTIDMLDLNSQIFNTQDEDSSQLCSVRKVNLSPVSIQDPGSLGWGGASCRPARNKMTQNIQQCPHSSPLFRLMISCPLVQLHICTLRVKLFLSLSRFYEHSVDIRQPGTVVKCPLCSNTGPQSECNAVTASGSRGTRDK